jgi:hypothetical protein
MGPITMLERQKAQLADMTKLVRGKLSSAARVTIGALTVIDVHARDVIIKLDADEVSSEDHFSWMSQLRYYWTDDNLQASMVAASRPYGYEYLGNTFRLVITPVCLRSARYLHNMNLTQSYTAHGQMLPHFDGSATDDLWGRPCWTRGDWEDRDY